MVERLNRSALITALISALIIFGMEACKMISNPDLQRATCSALITIASALGVVSNSRPVTPPGQPSIVSHPPPSAGADHGDDE